MGDESILQLDMVKSVYVDPFTNVVSLTLQLPHLAVPSTERLRSECLTSINRLEWVSDTSSVAIQIVSEAPRPMASVDMSTVGPGGPVVGVSAISTIYPCGISSHTYL